MNKQFLDTIRATNECSLEEYIYVYPRFMKEHINREGGRDNTELSFIKEQIKEHETYIEIEKHTQKRFLDIGYADNKHLNYEDYNLAGMSFTNSVISQKAIINYLKTKKSELKSPQQIEKIKNQNPKHEKIFCNNGFVLFDYILTNHIAENRGRINDISYYYWKMYNDNYIIQKPFVFVEWFMSLYEVENFQIKTLESIRNPNRLKNYSNSLDWFKLQNH